MFGIGETELVIIVVFAFLLFGPDKLPGMGRTLGRVLRQFREASDGFTEVVQTNIMDPASEELEKSPKQRKREAAELDAEAGVESAGSSQEAEEAPQPRRETFAERKARLLAERKAAEAAAAAAAEVQADVPVDTEQVGAQAESAEQQGTSQPAPQAEQKPTRTSAADLYAVTSQKSSRTLAKEAAREAEQEARAAEQVAQEADRAVAPVSASATEAPSSGEEDGEE
ncbi:MAG: twin-arginine translocase TatA/TatE family subunit [Atopobiaceae bacterium]|nr:twin-arginine translocase TatA/TatE family subunit [Atopobiaceae bacterium]